MATSVNVMTHETSRPATEPAKKELLTPQRRLWILGGLAVLVLLGIWFFVVGGRRKEQYATRALDQARAAAEAGNLPLASSELQKLIQGYGDTDAGKEAVISLNQIRMINGQAELAVVGLREFLQREPEPEFAAPANGLLGAALENAGRPEEAGAAYEAASAAADVDYLKAEYLVEAARSYAASGKRDQAIALLRQVTQKYADTPVNTEAQVRLAELTGGKM